MFARAADVRIRPRLGYNLGRRAGVAAPHSSLRRVRGRLSPAPPKARSGKKEMKSPTLLRRLTTHACVVLLLSNFAPEGLAQRRRRANRPPRTQTQTQTQAPAQPPRVSPTPDAAAPARPPQPPSQP